MKIEGRNAFVTGANRGLGLAFVRALLAVGAGKVYAAARDTATLGAALALDPARVMAHRLDVTDPAAVADAGRLRDVDLLVNNAGILVAGDALTLDLDDARRILEVNVLGPLALARALRPTLEARRGAMLNILSDLALTNAPFAAAYAASKHAGWAMTQSLRAALEPRSVMVFAAFPGAIDTDMLAGVSAMKARPDDVARVIVEAVQAGTPEMWPSLLNPAVSARA